MSYLVGGVHTRVFLGLLETECIQFQNQHLLIAATEQSVAGDQLVSPPLASMPACSTPRTSSTATCA